VIRLEVPGWSTCELEYLILDLNGTVTLEGQPIAGVEHQVARLSADLVIHLASADTYGRAEEISRWLGCQLTRIEAGREASQKRALVERLGAEQVVAIGNGANDAQMLSAAALGIAVLGREGLASEALQAADLVVSGIEDALDLLLHPQRLIASLRR